MATDHCQPHPLVFLTTSDGYHPTGRNARAQARAQSARRSNPNSTVRGTFSMFSLDEREDLTTEHGRIKGRECGGKVVATKTKARRRLPIDCTQLPPFRVFTTYAYTPENAYHLPSGVILDDILKVAAFHIRRRTAQVMDAKPEYIMNVLRCRQWCQVSTELAALGRSPYLDGAIACVVSKVQHVISGDGKTTPPQVLACYAQALHALRTAVTQPTPQGRLDVLAATQLLAIYEMLDFPEHDHWMPHVAGAAVMARLYHPLNADGAFLPIQAAPVFVEALLNGDASFFETLHWKGLLHFIVVKRYPSSDLCHQSVSCLTAMRTLVIDGQEVINQGSESEWADRLPLLSHAHQLRHQMKSLILRGEESFRGGRWCNKSCDVLGLFLISVMMLDKLIRTLQQAHMPRGRDLDEDTQELCTQMIRMEMYASDADPGKALLLAFQRQMNHLPPTSGNEKRY